MATILTLDFAGRRQVTLCPDALELSASGPAAFGFREALLELASDPSVPDFREAQIVLGLRPDPEPDQPGKVPGKTACHWCGRSAPAGGLTTTGYRPVSSDEHVDPKTLATTTEHHDGPAVPDPAGAHCVHEGACMATHLAQEPEWADHQVPQWRQDYQKYLDAERKRLEAASHLAWAAYHPKEFGAQRAQIETQERQLQALAAEFAPPDSFYSDFAVALAKRNSDAVELAASVSDEDLGIGAPDTEGPAPFQMEPGHSDNCDHITLRCPWNRTHLHGAVRTPSRADAASTLAWRTARSG
jgi:hypothetical protein